MDRAQSSVDMMDLIIESLDSVLVLVYVVDFFFLVMILLL